MKDLYQIYRNNKEAIDALATIDPKGAGKVFSLIENQPVTFLSSIEKMQSLGLSASMGDYYVYTQRGGKLAIDPTPRGNKKILAVMGNIIVNDGAIRKGDTVSLKSCGRFDVFSIEKDMKSALLGGEIIASYAFATVLNSENEAIASKLFLIPANEYSSMLSQATGWAKTYPTMFASKVAIKRVISGIHALLGRVVTSEQQKTLRVMEESSRIDLDGRNYGNDDQIINREELNMLESKITDNAVNKAGFAKWLLANGFKNNASITKSFYKKAMNTLDKSIKSKGI